MYLPHKSRLFALVVLLLLAAYSLRAQQKTQWTWKDADGNTHTRAELDRILKQHDLWVSSKHKSGQLADLHRADLTGAFLNESNLAGADLTGVNLQGAYLGGANLTQANLMCATVWNRSGAALRPTCLVADLTHAVLDGANLTGALLRGTNLTGAKLYNVNLGNVDLTAAKLGGAQLGGANLTGAYFRGADMSGTVFEPRSPPEVTSITSAENLERLTYKDNPEALVQLRKLFADGGFSDQERKITYALKRRETELSWEGCRAWKTGDKTRAVLWSSDSNLANCGSFVLNRVFFDWTCQYGMSPGRPLTVGFLLWLLCSVLYFICIHVPERDSIASSVERSRNTHRLTGVSRKSDRAK